jgi:hypothetical protein
MPTRPFCSQTHVGAASRTRALIASLYGLSEASSFGTDSSLQPRSHIGPAIRFSVAPDGKSFAYAIAKPESSLWMLQGFAAN